MAPQGRSDELGVEELAGEELLPGTVLEGRYRILERLDEGGIGLVYRAQHVKLRRLVAVKVLQRRFTRHASLRPRFEREARALAALSHPNVVAVTDFGLIDGRPFLVMELLSGRTLREAMDEGALPIDRAVDVMHQLLRGLAYAHHEGVVHRDIKPGNVFLRDLDAHGGEVKLLDFGFALLIDRLDRPDAPDVSSVDEAFGTPAYMAPEQLSGGTTGPATDVYCAGVLLFELLTGHKPFRGELSEVVRQHLSVPPPALSTLRPQLRPSPELEGLVSRALSKSPDLRYPDAGAMLAALDALPRPAATLEEEPPRGPAAAESPGGAAARGTSRLTIAALLVAFAGAFLLTHALLGGDAVEVATGRGAEPETDEGAVTAAVGGEGRARIQIEDGTEIDIDDGTLLEIDDGTRIEQEDGTRIEIEDEAATRVEGEGTAAAAADPGAPSPGTTEGEPPQDHATGDAPDRERAQDPSASAALAAYAAAVESGEGLDPADIRTIRRLAAERPEDPAPHLLLGRAYLLRGWWSDAVERYELACRIDPEARHAPHALEDVVRMATSASVGRRAERAVTRIWGEEARPAIDAALADPALGATGRRALERLRSTLGAD